MNLLQECEALVLWGAHFPLFLPSYTLTPRLPSQACTSIAQLALYGVSCWSPVQRDCGDNHAQKNIF